MQASDRISRRILGIDYQVWLTVLVTWLACAAIYGFRGMIRSACPQAAIWVDGRSPEQIEFLYPNRLAVFRIQAAAASTVKWDFGDGTRAVYGRSAGHRFAKEGTFRVRAVVDGRCTFEQQVQVKGPLAFTSPEKAVVRIFADSTRVKVGSTLLFTGVANIPVRSWEWKLLNPAFLDARYDSVASFTFSAPGKYTVHLTINNNPAVTTTWAVEAVEDLQQLPEPLGPLGIPPAAGNGAGTPPPLLDPGENPFGKLQEDKGPAKKDSAKAPDNRKKAVHPETFKAELLEVIEGKKTTGMLIEKYLAYGESTKVKVNNEERLTGIVQFIEEMKQNRKKYKLESVELQPDDLGGIQTIRVRRSKVGIVKRILH